MTVYATSDWHLGHTNIQTYEPTRPADLEERLWAQLVEKIHPGDTLWFLGDFCFYRRLEEKLAVRRLSDLLKGVNAYWVLGNHDSMSVGFLDKYGFVADKRFLSSDDILFSHYPPARPRHLEDKPSATRDAVIAEWETGKYRFCVHGHVHSARPAVCGDKGEFINVSPEVNNFSIVNLSELLHV
jgi:calcineurin-like phosphoesterase family protein